MGWSLSVPCKSIKARDDMLAFLGEHYRDAAEVLAYPKDHWRHQHPKPPSQFFAYGHSNSKIGFDKPNDYEAAILRWIATKVGMRRKFPKRNILTPVPWLNCDGHGSSPVIPQALGDGSEENAGNLVDEVGWQGVARWWEERDVVTQAIAGKLLGFAADADKKDTASKAEVTRLNGLWGSKHAVSGFIAADPP